MITHQKPEIIWSHTDPMRTPNKTDEEDDNNNIININDNT